MNGAELLQIIISEMHGAMIADVKDLSPEHLSWKPAPEANPIAFLFWHVIRTEDNMVHNLLGEPPIWQSQKWEEKLNMEISGHGTGFQAHEVDKVVTFPISEVMAYAKSVIQSTEEYLTTLNDEKLDFAPDPERPKRTIGMILRNFVVAHGWWHLGEIKYLKGLFGPIK